MKRDKNKLLPKFLQPYFWDVQFEELDITKNPLFVLKRVLDRGDTKAVHWALSVFDPITIKELITSSQDLSRKTANFWAEILGIDKKEVPCLQKPYSRIPFGLSS